MPPVKQPPVFVKKLKVVKTMKNLKSPPPVYSFQPQFTDSDPLPPSLYPQKKNKSNKFENLYLGLDPYKKGNLSKLYEKLKVQRDQRQQE
jgi:hypothetical protein